MKNPIRKKLWLLLFTAMAMVEAPAATFTWIAADGGNWTNAANWDRNQAPGAGDDAVFSLGGAYSVTVEQGISLNNVVMTAGGASLNIAGNAGLTIASGFNLAAGVVNVAGELAAGGMILGGGTLNGPGNINLGGSNTWVLGGLGAGGRLTIAAGATLAIASGNDHNFPAWALTNRGTVIHIDGGQLRGAGTSIIVNQGLWLEQTDAEINNVYGGGPTVFWNGGTLRKAATAGTSTLQPGVPLYNSGLVDVQSGNLVLNGGGSDTGVFNVATNSTCNFNSPFTISDGARFTGTGISSLNSTISFNGTIMASNLQWYAGTWLGNLTVPAGSTIQIVSGNDHNLFGLGFTNQGIVTHTGGRVRGGSGAVLANQALWLESVDTDFNNDLGGAGLLLLNTGTFRKNASTGGTRMLGGVTLQNDGLVDLISGTVEIQGGGANTGAFAAATNTACYFENGYYFADGSSFFGQGGIYLYNGIMTFGGAIHSTNLQWYGSSLAGTLTIPAANVLYVVSDNDHNFPGVTITNQGTVIHNAGRIRGGNGAVLMNGGLWLEMAGLDFNNDYGGAATSLLNAGTFRQTGTVGDTRFLGGVVGGRQRVFAGERGDVVGKLGF